MADTPAEQYSKEWEADSDEKAIPKEQQTKFDARSQLAIKAREFVEEAIQGRNQTQIPHEIRRSYELYNAVGLDYRDTSEEFWEGTRLSLKEGSKVVQNILRQITNDGCSQLGDLLYPTDQDNFGLLPVYPAKPPLSIQDQSAADANGEPMVDETTGEPVTNLMAWKGRKAALDHKVERMLTKIKGTMNRVEFGKLGRTLIESGGQTGTAVLKGPFVDPKRDRRWARGTEGAWDLHSDTRQQATYKVINPIDFLPDMSATCTEDMSHASTREWLLARQVRSLRGLDYFDEQVEELLARKPEGLAQTSEGDTELRAIRDNCIAESMYGKRYEVFETWADFPKAMLRGAGVKAIPGAEDDDDNDGDDEVFACVIHCAGICLKAFVSPQQATTDMPFSVWSWDEDPNGLFGKSIPLLGENSQLIYNAAWRMILDHGGVSAVPMVTMLRTKVTPAEGDPNDYSLRGGKVWYINGDTFNLPDGTQGKPFEVHDIPIHLDQFFAIMEKAEEDAYKLTGVTRVEKNAAGVDNAPLTLGATQIYQNNSSVARRRQVRRFDDLITKTTMTRQYSWHMEFEEDDEIKGNMTIEPRGSSVLMQRETNTQNLMMLLQNSAGMPGMKTEAIMRTISEGMQFPQGKFTETQDETDTRKKAEAENPPIDPELQIAQAQLETEQAKVEGIRAKNEAEIELRMAEMQAKQQIDAATLELKAIDAERKHIREMTRLQQMGQIDSQRLLAQLDKQEQEAINKASQIKTLRDIEASRSLSKEATDSQAAQTNQMTAEARLRDASTKESELRLKASGQIKQGV